MATIAITRGYNDPSGFTSGETITPAKLNSAQSPTAAITFATADDTDNSTLEVSGGKFRVKDGGIVAAKIASAAVTPAKLSQPLTAETALTLSPTTARDFTGIPSWVRRITVTYSGAQLSGSEHLLVQVGAGSLASSGYASRSTFVSGGVNSGTVSSTAGFIVYAGANTNIVTGAMTLLLHSSNLWIATEASTYNGTVANNTSSGVIALGGTLDRLRFTSTNASTNVFNAGTVNIMYEG
jgi:hypothetical protein